MQAVIHDQWYSASQDGGDEVRLEERQEVISILEKAPKVRPLFDEVLV